MCHKIGRDNREWDGMANTVSDEAAKHRLSLKAILHNPGERSQCSQATTITSLGAQVAAASVAW